MPIVEKELKINEITNIKSNANHKIITFEKDPSHLDMGGRKTLNDSSIMGRSASQNKKIKQFEQKLN